MYAKFDEVGGFQKNAQPRRNKSRDEQSRGRKQNKPKRFDKTNLQ